MFQCIKTRDITFMNQSWEWGQTCPLTRVCLASMEYICTGSVPVTRLLCLACTWPRLYVQRYPGVALLISVLWSVFLAHLIAEKLLAIAVVSSNFDAAVACPWTVSPFRKTHPAAFTHELGGTATSTLPTQSTPWFTLGPHLKFWNFLMFVLQTWIIYPLCISVKWPS